MNFEEFQNSSRKDRPHPGEMFPGFSGEKEKTENLKKWGPKFFESGNTRGEDYEIFWEDGQWYVNSKPTSFEEAKSAIGPGWSSLLETDEEFRKIVEEEEKKKKELN